MATSVHWNYFTGFNTVFRNAVRSHGARSGVSERYGPLPAPVEEESLSSSDEEDASTADTAAASASTEDASSSKKDAEDPMDESNAIANLTSKLRKLAREYAFTYRITKAAHSHARTPFDFYVVLLEQDTIAFFKAHRALRDMWCPLSDGYFQVDLDDLYPNIRELRDLNGRADAPPGYKALVALVEELFATQYAAMDEEIAAGEISYGSLWYYFDEAGRIFSTRAWNAHRYCYAHKGYSYERGRLNRFVVTGTVSGFDDKGHKTSYTVRASIPSFTGRRPLKSLPLRRVTDLEPYRVFGRRTREMHEKACRDAGVQMQLRGIQIFPGNNGAVRIYRDQRCMVSTEHKNEDLLTDLFPLQRDMDPSTDGDDDDNGAALLAQVLGLGGDDSGSSPENTDDERHTMADREDAIIFPFCPVYNLGSSKLWGYAHVDDLHAISYAQHRYEDLVMDEERKQMIRHLVSYHRKHMGDGGDAPRDTEMMKGRGLLFMLHGPPGVGKTLTAETVADNLRKPLYVVSSADISLDTSEIEHNLSEIQRLCRCWNCVMLLDEADIFLEARDLHNVARNAIVATFLRFLEFTENIIFLTTNRLRTLDPAIQSRIHLILKYDPLTEGQRVQVWQRALRDMMPDPPPDYLASLAQRLAGLDMNGREIHNAARVAISSLVEGDDDAASLTKTRIRHRVQLVLRTNRQYENRAATSTMYM